MSFDLWQRNADAALSEVNNPSGSHLPGWFEGHGPQEILLIISVPAVIGLFVWAIVRRQVLLGFIVDALVNLLAALIRTGRAVRRVAAQVWAAAVERA